MPSIKRNVASAPDRTGFEPYEGPTPPKGFYRGVIKAARVRKASTGRLGFSILTELKASPGSDAVKYDGYPAWTDIWLGDEEALQSREKAFYLAVAGKADDINVVHDDLDDGGKITKVGGKSPIGAEVLVEIRIEDYEGEKRARADTITKVKTKTVTGDDPIKEFAKKDEDEEKDLLEEAEDDTWSPLSEDELKKMSIPELKEYAKELEVSTRGIGKKSELIAALITAQDEIVANLDTSEEDEDEDVDEDDEVEEDEDLEDAEETENPVEVLKAELAGLDRNALKARIRSNDDEFKILKRHTDDELREVILGQEIDNGSEEEPF